MGRQVYDCELFDDCVVKVEDGSRSFQNIVEWETWERVRGTEFEKWFAPCVNISPSGSVLIMKKTIPILQKDYPKKMPVFLTDFKYSNYGEFDGRFVCHDYGTNLLFENGMSKRMKKADWWS